VALTWLERFCYTPRVRAGPWSPFGTGGRVDSVRLDGGDRKIEREVRINERIRAREVRLIDEKGAQLGILPVPEALRIARERNLDLIEVAPNAQPPVCRIMDYGKHKYEQARRERETRHKSKTGEVRLLRMKPQIGPHDLGIKIRKLRELLGEGNKVRVTLRFRGREMSRPELGVALFGRIAGELADVAQMEGDVRREGRMMNMMLAPKPGKAPKEAPANKTAPKEAPKEKRGEKKERVASHVQEQVQSEQVVQPPAQAENPEDSGEAG
jgi:translation initiation factor IF-3